MKRSFFIIILLLGFMLIAGTSHADTFVINQVSDLFNPVGDFIVAGGAVKSSPGQVFEVLGGPLNDLHDTPSETGTRNSQMGSLWSILDAGGITSTHTLVFGFGLDETGAPGTNPVDITALSMTFNLPSGTSQSFYLGSNVVTVYGNQGASGSEARFQVILPFDFMTTFGASSTQPFTISSTIDDTDDGPEIYFLDAGMTANPPVQVPVPEPGILILLGIAMSAIGAASWKIRKL